MTAHDPPGASYAIGAVRSVGSNRTSSNNHPSGQCPKVQYSIRLKGDTGEATPLPSSSQDRRRERNHGKFNRFRFQTMRGNPLADGRNHRRWDRARQIPLQLLRLKGEPSSASGGFSSQKKKKKDISRGQKKAIDFTSYSISTSGIPDASVVQLQTLNKPPPARGNDIFALTLPQCIIIVRGILWLGLLLAVGLGFRGWMRHCSKTVL